jgi:hypothetical protein
MRFTPLEKRRIDYRQTGLLTGFTDKMKIVFLILLIILFMPLISPASWTVGTVDNSGLAGKYTSITLDSSGEPHISYSSIGSGTTFSSMPLMLQARG